MADEPDVAARLMAAYDNLGTGSREDLKIAADTIISLRDNLTRLEERSSELLAEKLMLEKLSDNIAKAVAKISGSTVEDVIEKFKD